MSPGFDLSGLESLSYQLGNAAGAIEDLLNRLSTVSSEYTYDWKGASRQQYDADFADLCSRIESLASKVYSLSSAISSLASELATKADDALDTFL